MTSREQARIATIKSIARDYCDSYRGTNMDRELVAIEVWNLSTEDNMLFVEYLPEWARQWYLHGEVALADRLGSGPQTVADDPDDHIMFNWTKWDPRSIRASDVAERYPRATNRGSIPPYAQAPTIHVRDVWREPVPVDVPAWWLQVLYVLAAVCGAILIVEACLRWGAR